MQDNESGNNVSSPIVSVVIPVYNVEGQLQRCIDSVLGQTLRNIEIILVDDGSTDSSPAICEKAKTFDNRVTVIHKSNGGLSSARNAGLDCAVGKYLLFVDSDDYIESDSCEVLSGAAERFGADVVAGDWAEVPVNTASHYAHIEPNRVYNARSYMMIAAKHNELYPCSVFAMYRRRLFSDGELCFEEGILHEDMELMPKIYLAASRVVLVDKVFYHYILRKGSINGMAENPQHKSSLRRVYAEWYELFNGIDDPDLRRVMLGYLAKYYLYSVRVRGYDSGFDVEGITGRFLRENALNIKERIKALVYSVSPRLFCKLGGAR